MDGLLVDSETLWRKAHMNVLADEGFKVTYEEVQAFAGIATENVVAFWQKRFGWNPKLNQEIIQKIVDYVGEEAKASIKTMPGAYEAIDLFKKHDLPLGVASSSQPHLMKIFLDELNISKDIVVSRSAHFEKHTKPFPDVYLTTARMLGVEPANCLVFEDSLPGVKSAKAAGMKCVAVPEPPYDNADFSEADLIVSSLLDINWETVSVL